MEDKKTHEKEKKDQQLHIRITKSQKDFLDMLSYENDKSRTEMVWKALEFYHNFSKGTFN